MSMTKRDFEALASAIKSSHSGNRRTADYKAAVRVVNNLLPHLRSVNAAFDDERFILACGMQVVLVPKAPAPYPFQASDLRFALCA